MRCCFAPVTSWLSCRSPSRQSVKHPVQERARAGRLKAATWACPRTLAPVMLNRPKLLHECFKSCTESQPKDNLRCDVQCKSPSLCQYCSFMLRSAVHHFGILDLVLDTLQTACANIVRTCTVSPTRFLQTKARDTDPGIVAAQRTPKPRPCKDLPGRSLEPMARLPLRSG